jgi:hypothetical protein
MYKRRYSGQLDYDPAEDGFYAVEAFIIKDNSIGFSMTEVARGSSVGWKLDGTATKEGTQYVASNIAFRNSGATSLVRTVRFCVVEEVEGEMITISGSIEGADIPNSPFEGTLEAQQTKQK